MSPSPKTKPKKQKKKLWHVYMATKYEEKPRRKLICARPWLGREIYIVRELRTTQKKQHYITRTYKQKKL
jgi:hypothetical protein